MEGGWATTKTQGTVLTPAIIAEVVKVMDRISTGFNGHLRELELPSLDILKPIGSGTWWSEDLTDQPTSGDNSLQRFFCFSIDRCRTISIDRNITMATPSD